MKKCNRKHFPNQMLCLYQLLPALRSFVLGLGGGREGEPEVKTGGFQHLTVNVQHILTINSYVFMYHSKLITFQLK